MAGILTFNVGEVRRLYEHSRSSKDHTPSYGHLFEGQYYKGGEVLCEDGSVYDGTNWPSGESIDYSLIPACLILVGDQGVYLMSNGTPPQLIKEGENARVVAYARECDPTRNDHWHDAKVSIFGGDDGSDPLPIDMFANILSTKKDSDTFRLCITAKTIKLID